MPEHDAPTLNTAPLPEPGEAAVVRLGRPAAERVLALRVSTGKLIDGDPRQTVCVEFESPDGQFCTGLWTSEPGAWRVHYTEQEYCRILEGRHELTDTAGHRHTFGPGDEFVVPAGFQGTWRVVEATRKRFVIFEPRTPAPPAPSPATVEAFVQLVEAGRTIEAMERFYAEHATMQENEQAPRVGKGALIAHERAALASVAALKATCVRPILQSGATVVIRWIFEIEDRAGKVVRFEELAHQRWEGDLIVEEKFFYDPGQLRPASPPRT